METVCHKQLIFGNLFSKEVIADFEGGRITSDAGGSTLKAIAAAQAFGLKVVKVIILVDREAVEKMGPQVEAVFTLSELR